jgi:hypothetical protein
MLYTSRARKGFIIYTLTMGKKWDQLIGDSSSILRLYPSRDHSLTNGMPRKGHTQIKSWITDQPVHLNCCLLRKRNIKRFLAKYMFPRLTRPTGYDFSQNVIFIYFPTNLIGPTNLLSNLH